MEYTKIDTMIIDDNPAICEYLEAVIQWEELGLRLVCKAGDSEHAWELYHVHHPKIVITDIGIPVISGLDLAKQFLEHDENLRIIVITGLNDIKNVKDAVSIGAIDLLTKPIQPDKINASLRKATEHIIKLRTHYQTDLALKQLMEKNHTLLQERLIAQLLSSNTPLDNENITGQLSLLSLHFPGSYFAAVSIHLSTHSTFDTSSTFFPAAFKEICDRTLSDNGFTVFSFYGTLNRLDCLLNWSFEKGDMQIETALHKLLDRIHFHFQMEFLACIGGVVNNLSDLHWSFEQAQAATHYATDNLQSIISYQNISALVPSMPVLNYDSTINQLISCLQGLQIQQFYSLLEKSCVNLDLETLREFSLELLSRIAQLCFHSHIQTWNIINYPETIEHIFRADSSVSIFKTLKATCEILVDTLLLQRNESQNQLIQFAKRFIKEHLREASLSLETVSSHIGLSKIYFGQLFIKEEGISFNVYLNRKRISLAKKLLLTTTMRSSEISDHVGYSNPKYFNYVFKQMVGHTPLDFRKNNHLP